MTRAQQALADQFKAAADEPAAESVEVAFKRKPKLAKEIARLAQEYVDIRDSIKALEEQKRETSEAILTTLLSEDVRSVLAAKHKFTQAAGRVSKKLNQQKLMLRGVSLEILAECTDVTEGSPYLVCTAVK